MVTTIPDAYPEAAVRDFPRQSTLRIPIVTSYMLRLLFSAFFSSDLVCR
jgi:hypothetical protein